MNNVEETINAVAEQAPATTEKKRLTVRDEEGNFLFHTAWLADYIIVNEPGTYEAVVTSEPQLYDPAKFGEEGNPRYIINVKAVLQSSLPKIKQILKGKEKVKADMVNEVFMNGTIWMNEDGTTSQPVPHKRQRVEVAVDFVENRDGEQVLRITDVFGAPVKKATKIDLDALFADDIDVEGLDN